jgi:hypothetical protein
VKIVITSKEFGHKKFDDLVYSLFLDANVRSMLPREQVRRFKKKFRCKIRGGHYDKIIISKNSGKRLWNTHDAYLEFSSRKAYVLFMLEWS